LIHFIDITSKLIELDKLVLIVNVVFIHLDVLMIYLVHAN